MYQTTVKCKNLRLVERFNENQPKEVSGHITMEKVDEYTEGSLEGFSNNTHFYFNFPVSLLDPDIKIGDEIIVTFSKKAK